MSFRPSDLIVFILASMLSPGAIFWFWVILLLLLFEGPVNFLIDVAIYIGVLSAIMVLLVIVFMIRDRFIQRKYDTNLQAYNDEMAKAEESLPEREAGSSGRRL